MPLHKCLVFLAFLTFVFACKHTKHTSSDEVFVLLEHGSTGIDFENELVHNTQFNIIEYMYYYNGSGVGVGDFDGDGLEDIYFGGNQVEDKLYRNMGDLKFKDVSIASGISGYNTWTTGISIVDINGDGHLDIYVCKLSMITTSDTTHNLLFINKGDGTFKEQSKEYGLNFRGLSTQSAFLDYDNDGDLDIYLLNHNIHSINSYGNIKKRGLKDPYAGDIFYENRLAEEGKFVDVTTQSGIYSSPLGYGLAITVADINLDGWPDLYIGNDFHENDYIYINNKDKTFTESISDLLGSCTQFSMGVDIADINQDGLPDIFTTDMLPYDEDVYLVSAGEDSDQVKEIKNDFGFFPQKARNHFQLHLENNQFLDVAYITRTFATDWSWSVLLQDFDNDRLKDIFITNGIVKRPNDLDYINFLNSYADSNNVERSKKLIDKMPSQPLKNAYFRQLKNMEFSPIENSLVGNPSFSTGAAYADLDNDGDLDIITNNINDKAYIYENTTTKKNYVQVQLSGVDANTHCLGAKAYLYNGDQVLYRELQVVRGFLSSSTYTLHFGLGDWNTIDSIAIHWNTQHKTTIASPKINTRIQINSGEATTANNKVFFNKNYNSWEILNYGHLENLFSDHNKEKLIPERLSQEGPAFIYADLNGDGIKDVFLGGGRNQAAQILIGTTTGKFVLKKSYDLERDMVYEDVAAALIDFDSDGDLDIYVVSGGGDYKELEKELEDRLYINNGNGEFKRIPISLPHTNGSCIAVADFNGDGFDDMFIGARSIPSFYGLSPYSFILTNRAGTGVDIAYKERFGMITNAYWIDLNGDTFLDLAICGDWMPISIFYNNGSGELVEQKNLMGIKDAYGFWNSLAFKDFNNDGKMDIIAGNAGLNHKWQVNNSFPIKMYVGDFDSNGATEPLIFYRYLQNYVPAASMATLTSQMPSLKKQLNTYSNFKTKKNIDQLIPKYKEKLVEEKYVNETRSMIFISTDEGYTAVPLDWYDQLGEIQDICITPQGDIIYTVNGRDRVAEFGAPNGSYIRYLYDITYTNTLQYKGRFLSFPLRYRPRRIVHKENNVFWVVANNERLHTLNILEN